jgi:hypothetical protein
MAAKTISRRNDLFNLLKKRKQFLITQYLYLSFNVNNKDHMDIKKYFSESFTKKSSFEVILKFSLPLKTDLIILKNGVDLAYQE